MFSAILVFQLANVTDITQYLKTRCAALQLVALKTLSLKLGLNPTEVVLTLKLLTLMLLTVTLTLTLTLTLTTLAINLIKTQQSTAIGIGSVH